MAFKFLLPVASLSCILFLAYSALKFPTQISPQGCRMSWMSPSYVLQTAFNASWTTPNLAARYRLMLYREVGWDDNDHLRGTPVLFIPGNAGSAHQVRSIASSASRQYFSSPGHVNADFASQGAKPLDVFAVDFNEDLSAFHGPTLESQRSYTADAVSYILSLYPEGTRLLLMGHSMGGIVAVSLLPNPHISAIITMSTPHSVPPARFDSRMESIYSDAQKKLREDPTPILSICGGVTDTMIPSEFCALTPRLEGGNTGLRKTIFTSSLEGCWTGVGHQEMVWCHQVRWQVARALLGASIAQDAHMVADVFEAQFSTGAKLSKSILKEENAIRRLPIPQDIISESFPLVLRHPHGTQAFKLPIVKTTVEDEPRQLVIMLSQGSILGTSPANALPLTASIRVCRDAPMRLHKDTHASHCEPLPPSVLRLIPNPDPTNAFPVPDKGVDESDGVVVYKADVSQIEEGAWFLLEVANESNAGWLIATVEDGEEQVINHSPLAPFLMLGNLSVTRHPSGSNLYMQTVRLTSIPSHVLFVYELKASLSESCKSPSLLRPVLLYTSSDAEAHYHRLTSDQPILLHGHQNAPFLPPVKGEEGVTLTVFSSGECGVEKLSIRLDWWHSFGRIGARYWNALLTWSAGVVAVVAFLSLQTWDSGNAMPSPTESFERLVNNLVRACIGSVLFSLLPLPVDKWLGNNGQALFALLAPCLLLLSTGLVLFSWWIVLILLQVQGRFLSLIPRMRHDDAKDVRISRRMGIMTVGLMSTLVFLFVPWQVAFLACYIINFNHCALLVTSSSSKSESPGSSEKKEPEKKDGRNQKLLVLLIMTWCLPIVAPTLAVWVRTLATAGLTTPFDGDHNPLNVLSFMALTYIATSTRGSILFSRKHSRELISAPMFFLLGAIGSFTSGPRATYRMYESLNWPVFALFMLRVAPSLVG